MKLIDLVRDSRILACRVLMPGRRDSLDLKSQWVSSELYEWLGVEPIDVVKELVKEEGFKPEECLVWVKVEGVGSLSIPLSEDVVSMLKEFFQGV